MHNLNIATQRKKCVTKIVIREKLP